MARQQVIQIDCGRCGNKEYLKPEKDGKVPEDTVDLVITFLGKTTQFEDLCSRCTKTCRNLVEALTKDVKKAKKKGPK